MAPVATLTVLALALTYACAQYEEDDRSTRYISTQGKSTPPPPVAILKQINRHNEDGSYTYGYEGGDGSFKIETKSPTGEVKGKYGYKDDTGKLRVVEYGANKFGFQPAGEGITVAPPTLVDESERDQDDRPSRKQQPSRSQYRAPAAPQQQAVDYDYEEPAPQPQRPAYRPPAPASAQQTYRAPAPQPGPRPLSIPGAAPAPLDRASFFTPSQPLSPAPAPAPAYRAPKQQQQFSFESYQAPQQPQQSQIQYAQDYQPSPAQQRYTAAASPGQYQQQNQYQQQSQYQPQTQQPFSMLDQLLKEYALPQGGAAPLHDITFGTVGNY